MTDDVGSPRGVSAPICPACSAAMAHDQRYCLACGQRRGPLPHRFAALLGGVHERGSDEVAQTTAPVEADDPAPMLPEWMPAPRAAAVAILVMLAFGVGLGSLFSAPVESLARQVIVAVRQPSALPADSSAGGSSGNTGDGEGDSGPTTETITEEQTTPAPSTSTDSGGGGGSGTGSGSTTPAGTSNPALGLPPVHHVFLIVLSGQGVFQSFSPVSSDHYLAHRLAQQGELFQDYYGVAGSPLANAIALISGQGPNLDTAIDCPVFSPVFPGTPGHLGQLIGSGCQYPAGTDTLGDQLTSAGLSWRAYFQGLGPKARSACLYPAPGATDDRATVTRTRQYVTWRNPFVYFSSVTGGTDCRRDEVGIGHLAADLSKGTAAPTLSYIVPSPCADGSDTPCRPGAPAGLPAANRFLKQVVPEIEHSAAYKDNGLIAITFDEAPQTGVHADHSDCCATPKYPNLPAGTTSTPTTTTTTATTSTPTTTTATTSTITTGTTSTPTTTTTTSTTTTPTPTSTPAATGTGGGEVGLLLISPYIAPNTSDLVDSYNHYSLLRLIEDLFGLSHLGYANNPKLPSFGSSVFSAYSG